MGGLKIISGLQIQPAWDQGVKYFLCVDIFTKYAWVKSLTDKESKTVLDGFTKIVN